MNAEESTRAKTDGPRRSSYSTERREIVKETLQAKTTETEEGLKQINQYLLKKEIGRGAFGTVHLGVDTNTQKEYAIKEFSKSRLRKKDKSSFFRRPARGGRGGLRGRGGRAIGREEISNQCNDPFALVRGEVAILKKLHHENVVELLEVLDDPSDDSLYMVFEMCHKGAIMDVQPETTTEPFKPEVARDYFRQMVLGFEYLHENNIVHRDIKPDNLLLDNNGVLKIVDFGVSEMFVQNNDRLTKSAGSPAFMAPELCVANHGEISGKAADIWSMGITLYCMVLGRLPFTSTNIIELYESIRTAPIDIPSLLDPQLQDLLRRILERDPNQRISLQEIRNHPWVTENGTNPLTSTEENCSLMVTEVTEEELRCAIKSIAHIVTVLKAVSKLRRGTRSSFHSRQNSAASSNGSEVDLRTENGETEKEALEGKSSKTILSSQNLVTSPPTTTLRSDQDPLEDITQLVSEVKIDNRAGGVDTEH
ncbi:uncharacterized protein VTP21DRAFT_9779 [Calcarisporiella thermophila]|uniref:uncharacterized protein n=1 Tax=Calcarisporiella thermophila TaxID=911321 RepID=UPI00374233C4